MKVLLSGHGEDRAALDAARRSFGHRLLVLFSTKPDAEDLQRMREAEELAGVKVEIHPVDVADLIGCLDAAMRVLAREARSEVKVHVAGGSNLVTSALLLASFQTGREAFYCHPGGISTLPIAFEAKLEDFISKPDRTVLVALPPRGSTGIVELKPRGLGSGQVKGALLRLRKAGLVLADAEHASLTDAGRYYREQFARSEARA